MLFLLKNITLKEDIVVRADAAIVRGKKKTL